LIYSIITVKLAITYMPIRKIVLNVIFILRKTVDAIICNVLLANLIFAGCAWEIGRYIFEFLDFS
jgi:hypothetical protein